MQDPTTDTYLSVETAARGIFKDHGSKFIAFVFPVSDENEIKLHLQHLRKEYHDAKHHCYAYRIKPGTDQFRAYDDGEPSGTAGKPIYGQIVSFGLTNILIVVVRYFGGTLLGTSGLINAYRAAAKDCLQNACIVKRFIHGSFTIHFNYADMKSVMRIIREENINITEKEFESECSMRISVPKSKCDRIVERFNKIEQVRIDRH